MKRIGVDVGGTFTDLILVDEETGRITVDKVASTPADPARGTVEGVGEVCDAAGVALADVDAVLHGTTVATNLVLERGGASVGLITTEGMRDILHIARHKRPLNFSLHCELPWQSHPLVKRRHRLTVSERVAPPTGDVLVPLDDDDVRERVRELREAGVDAVAVCLLHSYLNPAHERRIKEIVREDFPEAYLSVSHEVLPSTGSTSGSQPSASRRDRPQARQLRRPHGRRAWQGRLPARPAAHAVERRHGGRREREGATRCAAHIRPRCRADRRYLGGTAGRP